MALTVKSLKRGAFEIGLVFLQLDRKQTLQLPEDGSISSFYSRNKIQMFGIQVRDRRPRKIGKRTEPEYANAITVEAKEVGSVVIQILSALNATQPCILPGFDLYPEFEWMSQGCPAISPFFTA